MDKFSLAIVFATLDFFSCLYILFHFTLIQIKFMQISLLSVCDGAVGTCSWFGDHGSGIWQSWAPVPCLDLPLSPAASYSSLQGRRTNFFGEKARVWTKMCRLSVNSCGSSQLLSDARRWCGSCSRFIFSNGKIHWRQNTAFSFHSFLQAG